MNKKDFSKPVVKQELLEGFRVRVSQIPPMDVAFKTMALTDYEILVAVIYRLNELIQVTQGYIDLTVDVLDWVMNDGLNIAVLERLTEWLNDGTLENLINETLFKMKLDKEEFYKFQEEDYEVFKTYVNNELQNLKDTKVDKSQVANEGVEKIPVRDDKGVLPINNAKITDTTLNDPTAFVVEENDTLKTHGYDEMRNKLVKGVETQVDTIEKALNENIVKTNTLEKDKMDDYLIVPNLKRFAYMAHGNIYGQGMYVDEEANVAYIGRPKMSSNEAEIMMYDLGVSSRRKNAPLLNKVTGDFGHVGSITKMGPYLYSTYQGGSNLVSRVNATSLIYDKQINVGRNLAAITYVEEEGCFYGIETANENQEYVHINLIKFNKNLVETEFKTYKHYRPKTTWWVQGLASKDGNFVISYTDALDHNAAKHGDSGVIEVRYSDTKLLSDYKFNRFHNAYFEMEAVQIVGDNIYFGYISNNYEYSGSGTGYEIFIGNLNDKTPIKDIVKYAGAMTQVYYNKDYTGEQKGTPLHPYSDWAFMFEDLDHDTVDIVLKSDVVVNWNSNYYNKFAYVRISGEGNKITGLLDFRGFSKLEIRNCVFEHSSYWGAVIVRKCSSFTFSSCTFRDLGKGTPAVGVLNSAGNISGSTFDCRHAFVVSEGGTCYLSSAKGTVTEIVWVMGGIGFVKGNADLTSTKPSRDSNGVVYS